MTRLILPASLGGAFTILGILALVDKPVDLIAATILLAFLILAVVARLIADEKHIRDRYQQPEFWTKGHLTMGYPHYTTDCHERHDLVRDFPTTRPQIVCLCGSTRFYEAFQEANYDRTMAGEIVLSVGFYPHSKAEHGHGEGVGHDGAEKVALDELHKRKIDLCDDVLVLNVGGYVGDSTRSEIEYARALGKPVRFLESGAHGGGSDE